MIVVTGATGQLGRLVIAELIKKVPPSQVVAVVRNPEKATDLAKLGVAVRQADYNQPQSWDAALRGATKVLLISGNEFGKRAQQHGHVIDAAKRAKVELLAYTSILHQDTSPLGLAVEHGATEALLRASGVPYVILRNGWYTENYAAGASAAVAHGVVMGSAGEGRIASAARADYAAAAAQVLTLPNQAGRVYELAGDEAFTLQQFAAELSRQSHKPVVYKNMSEAEYKAALMQVGVPEPFAALLADSDFGASKGGLFDDGHQLSKLIGRPTTPLSAVVKAALS